MVGLGETREELHQAFVDLRAVDCDILTVGQYLRPSAEHLPVERYYHPDEFVDMREEALALGSATWSRGRWFGRATTPGIRCPTRRRAERARTVGAAGWSAPAAPAAGASPGVVDGTTQRAPTVAATVE